MLTLYFDGLHRQLSQNMAYHPEAGLMCYGWLVLRDGVTIARGHGGYLRRKDANANLAEYLALIEGLQALRDMGLERQPVTIIGDSRSVIEQMQGTAGVSSPTIKPVYRRARHEAQSFRDLSWVWTPRRTNRAADLLTRRALRQIYSHALQGAGSPPKDKKRGKLSFESLLDLRVFNPAAV